jgi:hypothetical protein
MCFAVVTAQGPKMDAKEMEQLLREGAYAVLLEDDADAIKEFYEQVSTCVCDTIVVIGAVTEGTLRLHTQNVVPVSVLCSGEMCYVVDRGCNSYSGAVVVQQALESLLHQLLLSAFFHARPLYSRYYGVH